MIRIAYIGDFDRILDLCGEFWNHTMYSEPFSREHTLSMVEMAFEHGLLAVLDVDGVVGFIAGIKSPLLASDHAFMGTELAWWVDEKHRKGSNGIKLMKFMEGLAKEQGIKYWNMVSMQSSMPDKVNKIYERMGYTHSETAYSKVIK